MTQLQKYEQYLSEKGKKLTKEKEAVLIEALDKGEFTARELARSMAQKKEMIISRRTVTNCIREWKEAGMIDNLKYSISA